MTNQHPIIFVHGLFGFGPKELGSLKYWGKAFEVESPIERKYEASVGPISSAHDRACELAAQIKGTQVDYGEQHAQDAGHERFGDDFTNHGFLPEWHEIHPIHLVGHSLGAPTVRCLQHLLEEDYWGWGSNHRWVHSISTISGVLNGSTLVFLFGADEQTGLMNKDGLAATLLHMVELYTSTTGGLVNLDNIYDYDLDHWGYKRENDESLSDYLERVSTSRFLWEKDNAAYSLTLQGAYESNLLWKTYSDTYYFSYVTEQTCKNWFTGKYHPSLRMLPKMKIPSAYIGRKKFKQPPIPVADFKSSEWWENDGLVSTYSQMYPRTSGNHPVDGQFQDETPDAQFHPGAWYYKWERDMDHLDICLVPSLRQIPRQKEFYRRLFKRLAALPEQ